MEYATGLTLADASPVLGNAISASLTVNNLGPYIIDSTVWTYTISYDGFITGNSAPEFWNKTTATIYVAVPGIYVVRAVTTYTSTNPSAPTHPATTFTATADVSPPTTATPTSGFGANYTVPVNTGTIVLSDITSGNDPLGPYTSGWMQEWVPNFFDYNGVFHSYHPDWGPLNGPIDTFDFLHNPVGPGFVLRDKVQIGYDLIGGVGVDWSTIPDGDTVVSYVQLLRYAWKMTVFVPGGGPITKVFTEELNPLSWEMVKVSSGTWMLQPDQP